MLNDWIRDRTELFNRAADIFNEACLAKLMQEQKLENRQKQQEYCDALYAKVCTFLYFDLCFNPLKSAASLK